MNHPPAYEEHSNKPRPVINWDTPDGSWVGIWGYDWSDQLASEILKLTNEFEHEVCQPDMRADKIYSHTFKNGLTHRMFPVVEKPNKEIISPLMLTCISPEALKRQHIFHIGYPHFSGLNKELIDTYKDQKFVLTFHGETNLPLNALFRIQRNPFKKIFYLRQHFSAKRYFRVIDHVTYQTEKNINTLKRYYNGKLTKLTMGIDTDKFKIIDKNECKDKLMIPQNTKVLLTVSRLNDLKQVDKCIDVLSKINEDFIFLIVGHGTREYEEYLREKAKKPLDKNRIRFEGYKTSNELVSYYNAADLFIHMSKSEAGPVSIMEAMACGLPIFCTDTGNTAEVLKENNVGVVVEINNYKEWEEKLTDFLNDNPIKALDINVVKEHYDWGNVATKFVEIYDHTGIKYKSQE